MTIEFETKEREKTHVYYVNSPGSNAAEEKLEGLDDLVDAAVEVIEDQEGLYKSIMDNNLNDQNRDSNGDARADHDSDQSSSTRTSSGSVNISTQLATDEAIARQMQELENLHILTSSNEFTDMNTVEPSVETGESSGTNNVREVAQQDDIDPDSMTYEQLQSLEEAVGSENRGLSDDLISYLPSSKYKCGFFSRKGKHEECVICKETYKNREKLITLPCQHSFHAACIRRWLKIDKKCPVCKEEVFGP
uniref:RING-type domain-containing protein n=1 Tax=Ananas comosus var. bracteatus TaxID=296719 RepID=A0A6V7PHD4_ANACO|nr:unnamed protein product [Ananas comosus var. bracteatus]